ncbi:ATP-dependent Zn protease [Duganella sp. 1411]|nr:ATP-dependent Zn protease [Duganella sp. 1411]
MLLLYAMLGARGAQPLPYSDFKRLLYAGNVSEVTIADDAISGTLKANGLEQVLRHETLGRLQCTNGQPCRFSTIRVADPALEADLEASGARFAGQATSDWLPTLLSWIVPLAFLLWMSGMVAKKSGMPAGLVFDVGKSKARVYVARIPA